MNEASKPVCVYCGELADSEDHVPPQCLFEDVRLSELVAVPSCEACNRKFSRDDEFLRDLLVCATMHVPMKELDAPRAAMQRSLARKKHAGPIKRMLRRGKRTYGEFGGSPVLRPVHEVPLDRRRLHNVLQRIVRGLYFHETRWALPRARDYLITIGDLQIVKSAPLSPTARTSFSNLIGTALSGTRREIGGIRFGYSFRIYDEDPPVSIWMLNFLGLINFLCTAAPDRRLPLVI